MLYHAPWTRPIVEGTPRLLIEAGQVHEANLHHEEITREELLSAIQRQGADDVTEVERAVMEPSGAIVITARRPSRVERTLAQLDEKLDRLTAAVEHLNE